MANTSNKNAHFSGVDTPRLLINGTQINSTAAELDKKIITFAVTLGTIATTHVPIPVAGTVTNIYTVIDAALTTDDETLTFKNDSDTGMTGGVVTITQSGSAAGDKDTATPSANNSFAVGDSLILDIGGENGTAVNCTITIVVQVQ